jgi:hypothetical protein
LTEQEIEEIDNLAEDSFSRPLWQPNPDHEDGTPNTQRLAYESEADVIGLSGTAGWGKSHLLLGLAAMKHQKSVIFRRVFPNLESIIEDSRAVFNGSDAGIKSNKLNEQFHRWAIDNNKKSLKFEACQREKDKYKQRGRARDLYCFDEAPEFSRSQVEFITAWNRSPDKGQHCQVVLAFNPPTDEAGTWVIDYFLPWISYLFPQKFEHPNPARPGELRWYATVNGEETEFPNGDPVKVGKETIYPRSRTFFFGTLLDNPYYDEQYISTLQAQPEPIRSQLLYGDFAASTKADPWQVIPTAHVKEAQRRWLEMEKPDMPCSGVGVDVARGGKDSLAISKRYGVWYDEIKKIPGVNVEDGPAAAGMVYNALQDDEHIGYINVDIIGVGTSPYDSLKVMYPGKVRAVNASSASNYVVTKNRQAILKMRNVRAEYYWRFREALDPEHGDGIALPPGSEIVTDLCAARWIPQAGGVVQIEPKEDIKDRIGHSPDVGEAVLLAHFDERPSRLPGVVAQGKAKGWQ